MPKAPTSFSKDAAAEPNSQIQFALAPPVLSICDAARYLAVSPNFIETLMRTNELRYFVYGGKRIVEVAELNRWLDKLKADPESYRTGKLPNNILIAIRREKAA